MKALLAVGVPHRLMGGSWDPTALLATVAAVLIARFVVGFRLSPPVAAVAVLVGLMWSYVLQTHGVTPALAGGFAAIGLASAVARRVASH